MTQYETIPGFPTYKATTLGQIIGPKGFPLKPKVRVDGYLEVCLYHEGKKYWRTVHRLVCLAFHGVPKSKKEAAHLDGVKSNNTPDNLRWKTRRQNEHDKKIHGTKIQGSRHPDTNLTEDQVREIRSKHKYRVYTFDMLAEEYNITYQAVSRIIRRETWKHV